MGKWMIIPLILLCLAALSAAGAESAPTATLSDVPVELTCTPAANGEYGAYLFPLSEDVQAHAQLWQGDALLAEGSALLPALTLRLTANTTYTLRLTGSGDVRVEFTREALSRSFSQPLSFEDGYSKVIARPGDAHWYALDAPERPCLLLAMPQQEGLRLTAALYDEQGRLLKQAETTRGGAALLDPAASGRETLLLRIQAEEGTMTGLYRLQLLEDEIETLPEAVILSPAQLTLSGRQSARLTARLAPAGAGAALYWESADPAVARVSQEGVVSGLRAGSTTVSAYGPGGVSARCAVTVEDVRVRSLRFFQDSLSLRVGDEVEPQVRALPVNALDQRLGYTSSDESVVAVVDGLLVAVGEGEASVTARCSSGVSAALRVSVGPAARRYRALLIGELNYASTVASARPGTLNSLSSIRSMLESQRFDGARFQVAPTLLDEGRDGILAALRDTFGKAGDADLSLIYLTCHGAYLGGMTRFQLVDGSVLTAAELARALKDIRGELLVLLDCCGSGGAIGAASGTEDILSGIAAVFGGQVGGAPLQMSRCRVLASAALEQDSYRIRYTLPDGQSVTGTVFARALCEAGGWDMSTDARSALRADRDYDARVTLAELYGYLRRRMAWILAQGNTHRSDGLPVSAQTVQLWPQTAADVVFARTGEGE